MLINDIADLHELSDEIIETFVVRSAINDLLLVTELESGFLAFQAYPEALDEDGTEVDHRSGYVSTLRNIEWPLTFVGTSSGAYEAQQGRTTGTDAVLALHPNQHYTRWTSAATEIHYNGCPTCRTEGACATRLALTSSQPAQISGFTARDVGTAHPRRSGTRDVLPGVRRRGPGVKAIERDAAVRALNEAIDAMRLDFEGSPVTNMIDAIGRADRTVRRVRVSYEDALVEDDPLSRDSSK